MTPRRALALPAACLALVPASPTSRASPPVTAGFHVEDLGASPPLHGAKLWVPRRGAAGSFEALLLLHGNQPTQPDRTWMLGLHARPAYRRRILIVPGLARRDYRWGRRRTRRAVVALVERAVRGWPVTRRGVVVVGFSAGGSRVLSVARAMPRRVAGIVSVAGDIGRPVRHRGLNLKPLRDHPVLLVCMSEDRGPNASCKLDAANARLLRRRGMRKVAAVTLRGPHRFRFAQIGPVLDRWIKEHAR